MGVTPLTSRRTLLGIGASAAVALLVGCTARTDVGQTRPTPAAARSRRTAADDAGRLAAAFAWHWAGSVRTAAIPGCVVLSGIAGRPGDPHRLAVAGAAALARASHLWGDAPGARLMLVAPGRTADYTALTHSRTPAAVTLPADKRWPEPVTVLRPGLADGDPQVLASVLTHESVHVLADRAAVRASHGRVDRDLAPAWLREGMAEYISARSLGLTGALRAATRRASRHGAVPADLPSAADLTATDPNRRSRAYDQAWLAVALLVAAIGLHRATAWHRAWSAASARGGPPERPAVDLRQLHRQWRTQLHHWHA